MEPWLRKRARRTPDAPALVYGGVTSSFAALDAASDRVARALAACGLGAGDRVALLAAPVPRTIEVIHALQYLGAALVPINDRSIASEVRELAAMVRPRAVLHDRRSAPLIAELPPALAIGLDELVAPVGVRAGGDDDGRGVGGVPGGRRRPAEQAGRRPPATSPGWRARSLDGSGARRRGEMEPAAARPPGARELCETAVHSMLFTSGTTGRPKAACLTHANHEASARGSARHLAIGAGDRWLLCMPLCHVGGLAVVLRSAIIGFGVVLHDRFDAEAANRAIIDDGVTIVSLVPTMLARMLDALGDRSYPATLRVALTGGGPLPPALHARARAAGVPVVPTYGLTEAASQVATGRPGAAGSTGPASAVPLPGTELRIDDPDAAGVGEILVRGPTVMRGYFEDAAATGLALRDGWLHTGDAGRVDDDGMLTVVGRRSDLIVSGGENVYPAEVERVLAGHPHVDDVAVYGVPDDEWGERVVAAVVPASAGLDAEALRTWSAARLAAYKIPRAIRLVTTLPRTGSGKLRRAALRAADGSAA